MKLQRTQIRALSGGLSAFEQFEQGQGFVDYLK
jgi:hypothetical protein